MLARDAREEVWEQSEIRRQSADEHGLAAQRYYNILCMAYGANPASTQDLVDHGLLPKERAERCGGEYQQVQKAFRKLIAPYFDMKRVREAQKRPWLPPPSDTDWRELAVERACRRFVPRDSSSAHASLKPSQKAAILASVSGACARHHSSVSTYIWSTRK